MSGFGDDNDDTLHGDQPDQSNGTMSTEPWLDWTTALAVRDVIFYVIWTLGIPGNILSAIVWLRRRENPSAIYLAALAINDIIFLLSTVLCTLVCNGCDDVCLSVDSWFCCLLLTSTWSATFLEALLVLSFSVVRLIAIRRPLQVRCVTRFRLSGTSAVIIIIINIISNELD